MKLRLYNFKCYEAEEFTIPEQGLVLISAPSGSGKSTILEGILFALFGTGKKLQSWGKKSCKVELEYENISITRTKVPNRLVVTKEGTEYEDVSGQEIINRVFGDIFQTTSFVDNYNLHRTFILLSPTEKLAFLEKFAFQEVDLTDIKEKTKGQIKERAGALRDVQSKIETTQEILKSFPEIHPVEFPLKKIGKTPEEKLMDNERVRYKNTKVLIARNEKQVKTAEIKLQKTELYRERHRKLEQEIEVINNEIAGLSRKQENLSCIDDEEIFTLESKLKTLINGREKIELDKRIRDLQENVKKVGKQERDELIKTIKELKPKTARNPKEVESLLSNLYQQKSKAAEYEKINRELKEYADFSNEDLEEFKAELERNRKELEQRSEQLKNREQSKVALKCPKCETSLGIQHEPLSLVIYNIEKQACLSYQAPNEIEKEIEQIRSNIGYIQTTIMEDSRKVEEKKNMETKMTELKEFFAKQGVEKVNLKKLEEDIQNNSSLLVTLNGDIDKLQDLEFRLRNDKLSSGATALKQELEKLQARREALGEELVEIEESEEELQEKITEQKLLCREYDMLQERIEGLHEKLEFRRNELETLSQGIETVSSLGSIREQLFRSRRDLNENKKKIVMHEENIRKMEEYKNYVAEKLKSSGLENKILELEQEEKEIQHKLSAAELFRQKVLEGESIAIHNVIESINAFASTYLEQFFPDDSISVALLPFKEAKNKKSEKPQINLQILYKNEDCDISCLSGGELSRLVLAFTLALGEMFNTPALLLDECTASLDQVNTQNVFESIKKNFKNRLVLVVAHQVVEGSFDSVIKL